MTRRKGERLEQGKAHGHAHGHRPGHGDFDPFGNPRDLAGYLARLEDPERVEWQKPEAVIEALGVAPGMTVGEVGAGPGYFTRRLSAAVGKTGRVFAVEVVPAILEALRERLGQARNVTPILCDPEDPRLPDGSCDRILVVNTYHHFPDGPGYLRLLARALKPGGRIGNVDFEKRETPMGPPLAHRLSREEFEAHGKTAGLRPVKVESPALPYQYLVVLAAR